MKIQLIFLCALVVPSPSMALATPRKAPARHWVKTYMRKNGSVVQGHWAGSGFAAANSFRANRSGHSSYVPGSMSNFVGQDEARFSHSSVSNTSDHMYDTYSQDPTLEPSWIREQRREKADQAAQEAYLRSTRSKTTPVKSHKKTGR